MQHGGLTSFKYIVLFFPPLAALSTSCQPAQQNNNKEKWSPSEARLLLVIYVSISLFIHYPLCSQGSQLQVAFRSNCEQHDNCVSVACRNQTKHKTYAEKINIPALSFTCLKHSYFLNRRLSLYIFPFRASDKLYSFLPFFGSPYLTMLWWLNIRYCLVLFACCCGPTVQVGVGSVFGLLSSKLKRVRGKPASTRCYTVLATCLSLSSLSLLLSLPALLHIPAVCLSALSQWWCETWRQGAWAASSCQLTLWPPAPPPQLRVPRPQRATTGHLYWGASLCQEKSFFHVVWTIFKSNSYFNFRMERNLF